ncbi:MAG: hypothetical protein LC802_18450 [Acidobacteria bacterium]|nr:hypothetical protein [Acidobacteriota bacterium]
MKENDQFARAKMIMARVVSEKIPQAERWSVPKEFKSWIDGLSDKEFKVYLDRLSVLTRNLSDEEAPKETGIFVRGKSYPVEKMETKRRLDLIGGEASAYYALALWRTLEAEKLVRQLSGSE